MNSPSHPAPSVSSAVKNPAPRETRYIVTFRGHRLNFLTIGTHRISQIANDLYPVTRFDSATAASIAIIEVRDMFTPDCRPDFNIELITEEPETKNI